jgi:hypothetical protein
VERDDRPVETLPLHAHRDCCRLAAWDHQAVEADELIRRPDLGRLSLEGFQHPAVCLEVAL